MKERLEISRLKKMLLDWQNNCAPDPKVMSELEGVVAVLERNLPHGSEKF